MIGLYQPPPDQPPENLVLVITIDRPSPSLPEGYMSMTAHVKPGNPKQPPAQFEDAADGAVTEATIEAIVRDLRSYIATGKKAFINETRRGQEPGGRTP